MREEAGGIGEDEVVYIGILEGRVRILPEAVYDEEDAQQDREGVEGYWIGEEGEGGGHEAAVLLGAVDLGRGHWRRRRRMEGKSRRYFMYYISWHLIYTYRLLWHDVAI